MQASNLEQYLKACKEDREYREDLKDVITYASSELGLMTITVSYEKMILGAFLIIIALVISIITYKTGKKMLGISISYHLAKSQASSSSAARGIFS